MQQAKHTSMATWAEFEPSFNRVQAITGLSSNAIMMAIGYAGANNLGSWKQDGSVPLRAKYAIQGYLGELEGPTTTAQAQAPTFTFDELVALFGVLSGWQIPADVQKALAKKIAKEVANGAG